MRVVKRYPNRKLYDTENKEYITLDGIADLIRAGAEIHVIDHASGADLTAVTLTQIIFDQEKKRSVFLPRAMLATMIQIGGDHLSALHHSLLAQMGFLQQIDDEISQRIQYLVSQGELAEQEAKQILEKLLNAGSQAAGAKTFPNQEAIERILDQRQVPTKQDLDNITAQLDALISKLDTLTGQNDITSQGDA